MSIESLDLKKKIQDLDVQISNHKVNANRFKNEYLKNYARMQNESKKATSLEKERYELKKELAILESSS